MVRGVEDLFYEKRLRELALLSPGKRPQSDCALAVHEGSLQERWRETFNKSM